MTRAVVPLLIDNGVRGITIGCNTGSAPPAFPKVFVWRDELSEKEIITMVHPGGYLLKFG